LAELSEDFQGIGMNKDQHPADLSMQLSLVEAGVLKNLLYFDIFQYPLTAQELRKLHPNRDAEPDTIADALAQLTAHKLVHQYGEFYQIAEAPVYADRRIRGNDLAAKRLQRAFQRSRFVAAFPFVEAVMISGSLSKNYMEDGSDIDFFVITQPGRLWIARTLLIAYKKLFLFNSHKEFCLNYFIDTDHLEIEDKNIFTATEVAFLLPTHNPDLYKKFRAANTWADNFYPHHGLRCLEQCEEIKRGPMKRLGEWLLNGRLGEALDARFMRLTMGRWQKKFTHLEQQRFEVAMRSRKYVSKHHPSAFQDRVIGKLQTKQQELEQKIGAKLPLDATSPA
jgi:hypothetical protein